jgi:hypothetical protein
MNVVGGVLLQLVIGIPTMRARASQRAIRTDSRLCGLPFQMLPGRSNRQPGRTGRGGFVVYKANDELTISRLLCTIRSLGDGELVTVRRVQLLDQVAA